MFTANAVPAFSSSSSAASPVDFDAVEATLAWGDNVLGTHVIPAGTPVTLGEDAACTFFVPSERLGGERIAELLRWDTGSAIVVPPLGATVKIAGTLQRPGSMILRLEGGAACEIFAGDLVLTLRATARAEKVSKGFARGLRQMAFGQVAGSALFHAAILASLAYAAPALGSEEASAVDRENLLRARKMLVSAAEREEDAIKSEHSADVFEGPASGSGGGRAAASEGAMGGQKPVVTPGRWSARGDAKPGQETLSRERQIDEAREFGFINLLGTKSVLSAQNGPTVPWGNVQNGSDRENHLGNLWSGDIGDAFGPGLALHGTGEGGGCEKGDCKGIGLNDIGGLGHSLEASGTGGVPCPPGMNCVGRGHGPLQGGRPPHGPTMRMAGESTVNGQLPREVIQRIVRQNFGRFRQCYEAGMRMNPSLAGRIAVKFVIDRHGAVGLAQDGGSDLPDQGVVKCVVSNFQTLSFPEPQNGTVSVTYPIAFSPGE